MTLGTVVRPEETTTDTVEPRVTWVPLAGLERMTSPSSTLPSDGFSTVTSPHDRFAPSIVLRASDWLIPVTSGT